MHLVGASGPSSGGYQQYWRGKDRNRRCSPIHPHYLDLEIRAWARRHGQRCKGKDRWHVLPARAKRRQSQFIGFRYLRSFSPKCLAAGCRCLLDSSRPSSYDKSQRWSAAARQPPSRLSCIILAVSSEQRCTAGLEFRSSRCVTARQVVSRSDCG